MKTLKHEEVDAGLYQDGEHARQAITDFLETVYVCQHLQPVLDYKAPQPPYAAIFSTSQPFERYIRAQIS